MPKCKKKSPEQKRKQNRNFKRKRKLETDLPDENVNRKKRRQESQHRRSDQIPDTGRKQSRRKQANGPFRQRERARNTERRKQARQNDDIRTQENEQRQQCRKCRSWDDNRNSFLSRIREGPTRTCSCCGGLWFPSSIQGVDRTTLDLSFTEGRDILTVGDLENPELCFTCLRNIRQKKIPKLCLVNGLTFPPVPEILRDLSVLEERLCAPILPFLQIRTLGIDRQCGLRGNVVHIPNDIDCSVGVLPRNLNKAQTIPVQLCRRIEYDRNYLYQLVRPTKVIEATKHLLGTELYRTRKITMSEDWVNTVETQMEDFLRDVLNMAGLYEENDDDPINPGDEETMIFTDNSHILRIAPGQGKKPISLTEDLNDEVAAYPSIYCGVMRKPADQLTYSDISKSEMRRFDRRCAKPHKLLHSFKLLQNHQVLNAISICLRKKKGCNAIAANFLDENFITKVLHDDVGYQMLKQVRTSPSFWEQKQKHVLAMIRQLGMPTLFLTLSAAEPQWPELLCILSKVLEGKELNDEEALALTYEKKAQLIRTDPVTCARYFDYRLRQCFTFLLQPENGVFKGYRMKDYYCRIEFQHRGSPHGHMLIWLEGAPCYDAGNQTSIDECVEFIDSLISIESDVEGVIYQEHRKHTASCKRTTQQGTICRFGIPFPPLHETIILEPFPTSLPTAVKNRKKSIMNEIKENLEENRRHSEGHSLESLLDQFRLTGEEYVSVIRSTIKRPTVFLRRGIGSCYTNPYIPELAKLWRSNMDVQFILDPYGCAKYVCSYISKASGGVSKMLRSVATECRNSKIPAVQKMRKLGNTFLNQSEISAQEAAYGVLGLPLTKSSRDVIYIPTSPPDERISLIKSKVELQKLDPNSSEVFVVGLLDHYIHRPDEISAMCLAEFASMYTFTSKCGTTEAEEYAEEDSSELNAKEKTTNPLLPLKNKRGYIRRRVIPRIIRFRRYGEMKDAKEFYREQIMLYVPWRDEEEEVTKVSDKKYYNDNLEQIMENSALFNRMSVMELQNDEEEEMSPNEIDEEFQMMNDDELEADLFVEYRNPNKDTLASERIPNPEFIDEEEYNTMLLNLNDRQIQYLYHAIDKIQKSEVFNEFVYGGAGVGKSTLIKCIVQSLLRTFSIGEDLDCPKTLLAAPTGKAAFNIGGGTMHHTFCLPLTQFRGVLPPLSDDVCNTLASRLRNLKLLIIDEASMVSCEQLYQINSRMQQIFKSGDKFGGKSVLLLGDLRQLRPVCAKYIFEIFDAGIAGISGNPLWEELDNYELTEVMRQKEDKYFAEALNRLSRGELTSDDIVLFKSRELQSAGTPPSTAIWLFKTNKQVDDRNQERLMSLHTKKATARAFDVCQGKCKRKYQNDILKVAREQSIKDSMGLPFVLELVESARYMITLNVDVSDGLANGSSGILQEISYGYTKAGVKTPKIAWLEFSDNSIGVRRTKHMRAHGITGRQGLVPICLEKRIVKNWPGRDVSVVRTQFPLRVAESLTVNKSQGDSYDSVVVDVTALTRQALYVAFSRARTSSGLYVIGEFRPPFCATDDIVETEIAKLKAKELVLEEVNPLEKVKSCLGPRYPAPPSGHSSMPSQYCSPLSPEVMDDLRREFARSADPENGQVFPIIVRGINIYRDDFNSLLDTQLLLDNAVDGFLILLRDLENAFRLSVFRTQTMHYLMQDLTQDAWVEFVNNRWEEESAGDILFLPMCRNVHWTLFVAERNTRKVWHWDSLNRFDGHELGKKICRFIDDVDITNYRPVFGEWELLRRPIRDDLLQNNGWDCGVYVCLFALYVSTGRDFLIDQPGVARYRARIKESILTSRIVDLNL